MARIEPEYSQTPRPRDIESAFFHYFYGKRTNAIVGILESHGYVSAHHAPAIVQPKCLYRDDDMAEVAEALDRLAEARRAYMSAKPDHDACEASRS